MKVLILTSSFPRYEGDYFGPWVLEYARELKRQGHHVYVVAPASEEMPLTILSETNLEIQRFNYFFPPSSQKMVAPPGMIPNLKKNKLLFFHIPFLLWKFYQTAKKVIQTNKIDIIHSQWVIPGGFIGGLLAQRFQIPHFITSQGAEFFLPQKHPFSIFTKFTLKRCDLLFPVSKQMGERAKEYGINHSKIKVIPNTVNPAIFHPDVPSKFRNKYDIPASAKILLTVRRLVFEKRVEDVIEAFAQQEKNDIYLVIGGDGPDRNKLEKLCRERQIIDRVRFLGFVENKNLPPIYAASDIYVLSSQQEGLSLSLLESMASGLITISTSSTGGNEVIQSGVNGYLYPVGDIQNLAQIIRKVISLSYKDQKKLSEQARHTILEKFSVRKMVEQWLFYYKKYL